MRFSNVKFWKFTAENLMTKWYIRNCWCHLEMSDIPSTVVVGKLEANFSPTVAKKEFMVADFSWSSYTKTSLLFLTGLILFLLFPLLVNWFIIFQKSLDPLLLVLSIFVQYSPSALLKALLTLFLSSLYFSLSSELPVLCAFKSCWYLWFTSFLIMPFIQGKD